LLDLGQPVLSRHEIVAAQDRLRPQRRDGDRSGLLRRLPRTPRRPGTRARSTPPERRLHDRDLPVIVAPIMGLPVEESVLRLAPAGAATVTVVAITARTTLARVRRRRTTTARTISDARAAGPPVKRSRVEGVEP